MVKFDFRFLSVYEVEHCGWALYNILIAHTHTHIQRGELALFLMVEWKMNMNFIRIVKLEMANCDY